MTRSLSPGVLLISLALAAGLAGCGDKDGGGSDGGDSDGGTDDGGDGGGDGGSGDDSGASDGCNGVDDDGDGVVDEEPDTVWYPDSDKDGYGDDDGADATRCEGGGGWTDVGGDCDDDDSSISPAAVEVWYDDVDQDCDEWSDWDADGDGYDADSSLGGDGDDCDDTDDDVNPGASDTPYNGEDEDCDGEDLLDADGDGFDSERADGDDCDDTNAEIHPDAVEICMDDEDNDCDAVWDRCELSDGVVVAGTTADEAAGGAVLVTDLDGDAVADLVIGAAGGSAGAIYGVYGPLSASTSVSAAGAGRVGEADGDALGAALGAADLDGDGIAELVLGAPGAGDGAGAAYVFSGPVTGSSSLDAAAGTISGSDGVGIIGTSLVAADLDHDGLGDVAVAGALGDEAGTWTATVWLWSGPVTGTLDVETAVASRTAFTAGEGRTSDGVGPSVAVGDISGDGDLDLIVGSPLETYAAAEDGAAFVEHGPLDEDYALADAFGTVHGADEGGWLGFGVAAGDLDGDGNDDVVVGAPGHDGGAGAVYMVPGPLDGEVDIADADVEALGDAEGDGAGTSVAVADLDDDGEYDLIIGAPGESTSGTDAGAVYVFLGPVVGVVEVEYADVVVYGAVDASEVGSRAGTGVALGDATGDGWLDLWVGAPAGNGDEHGGSGDGSGLVWLVPGAWE